MNAEVHAKANVEASGNTQQPKRAPGNFNDEVEDDNMDIDEKNDSQFNYEESRGRNEQAQNASPSKSDIYYDSKGRQRKRSNSSKSPYFSIIV